MESIRSGGFRPPSTPVSSKQLGVKYGDGVDTLMEVALLPEVDSVVSNCMTLGTTAPPYSEFQAHVRESGSTESESVEARREQGQTSQTVEGLPIQVESQTTTKDGFQVTKGQVNDFQFESRTGFNQESGVYFSEGFIVSGANGEQLDFHREMRPLPDRSGTEFSGHIGGLPESGTIKMGADGLSIERQVGDYNISGRVTSTPRPPVRP